MIAAGGNEGNYILATEVINVSDDSTYSFGDIVERKGAVGGLLGSSPIICGVKDYEYFDSCIMYQQSQWTQSHTMTFRVFSASVQLNSTTLWILGGDCIVCPDEPILNTTEFISLNSSVATPGPRQAIDESYWIFIWMFHKTYLNKDVMVC